MYIHSINVPSEFFRSFFQFAFAPHLRYNVGNDENPTKRENAMRNRILIGNLISVLASFALLAGCLMKSPKKVYAMQVAENLILCVSSAFLGSWSGISTLLISTARNALLVKGRFDRRMMILFSVLVTVCGVWVNNRGVVGLLPVLATVILTVCNYYAREICAIKWSLIGNLALWAVYFFAITDIASGVTQIVVLAATLVSICRLKGAKSRVQRV